VSGLEVSTGRSSCYIGPDHFHLPELEFSGLRTAFADCRLARAEGPGTVCGSQIGTQALVELVSDRYFSSQLWLDNIHLPELGFWKLLNSKLRTHNSAAGRPRARGNLEPSLE
jgi:hypothetical protein